MAFKPFRPLSVRDRTNSNEPAQVSNDSPTPPAKRRRVSNNDHKPVRKANDGRGLHGAHNRRSPLSPIKNIASSSEGTSALSGAQESYYAVLW